MTRIKSVMAVVAVAGLFCIASARGELVNYQGCLTDNSGQPVPDTRYSISFSLWTDSTGGIRLWSETHSSVSTSKGAFSVVLGSVTALSASVFENENLFLQVAVGLSGPLAPRTRLVSVPRAALARRLDGDIATGEGFLHLTSPDSITMISLDAAGQGAPAHLTLFNPDPDYPGQSLIKLNSQSDGGHLEFFLAGDFPRDPAIRMGVDPVPWHQGRLEFLDPSGSTPHDPYIRMGVEPSPFLGGRLEFFQPSQGLANSPAIRMGVEPTPWKASLSMFNPQPGSAGSNPFFLLQTTPDSADLSLAVSTATAASPTLPGAAMTPDMAAIKAHCDVHKARADAYHENILQFRLEADSSGGSAQFLSDGSEYMGIEPSPWHPGGDLTMSDPTGATTIVISSEGSLGIGTSSTSRILTVKQNSATDPVADAWTIYSSRRWKMNIETIRDPLAKVMALRGVSFDWRETGKQDIGLIAEEVGQVVPEVVAYEDNGVDAQSVDYARLTALLIEAVKEQQRAIEVLTDRVSQDTQGLSGSDAATTAPRATPDLCDAQHQLQSELAEILRLRQELQQMKQEFGELALRVEAVLLKQTESGSGDLAAGH